MPIMWARSPVGAASSGPTTPPSVVATSTVEMARARWSTSARSAPAYRAWRLVALPAPYTNSAAKSIAGLSRTAARTTPALPTAPTAYPQAGPTAPRLRDASDGDRRGRAAGGEQGGGEPRQPGAAEHVLGEERPDRDAGGETGAAEDLGHDQHAKRPALELRGGGGHRPPV